MTRRRLILAIAAAVLCGVAWWLSFDSLSAEERFLVGTWTYNVTGARPCWMHFGADRRCALGYGPAAGPLDEINPGGPWFIRDGVLKLDCEPSSLRRAFRPVLPRLSLPVDGTLTFGLGSVTADELVLVMPNGRRETWTRTPAD